MLKFRQKVYLRQADDKQWLESSTLAWRKCVAKTKSFIAVIFIFPPKPSNEEKKANKKTFHETENCFFPFL